MKKGFVILSVLLSISLIWGCSKKEEQSTEKQQLEIIETTAQTEPETKGSSETETNTIAGSETAVITDTANENPSVKVTEENSSGASAGESVPAQNENAAEENIPAEIQETQPGEGVFGAAGKTEAQWLAEAQELYMKGCDLAFRYLCTGSEFPIDRENLEIIDKTYFLTACGSFEEATAPYYELFSKKYHSSDFEGLLLEQNGRLYAARAVRGMDMTYLSSQVDKLVSVSDEEAVFSVTIEYEEGESTAEFSLVLEENKWKIGRFTLPY